MKKMIRLTSLLFLLLFISGSSGCAPPKHTPSPTLPLFHQHMSKGEKAEAKKDLAQALDYYKKALIAAPRRSDQQEHAYQRVLKVESKMNWAKKQCREYKKLIQEGKSSEAQRVLKQVRHIWPFYSKCHFSSSVDPPPSTIPLVGSYRILNDKPLIHKIRRGDIISKLCQKYYGRTGNYKLVHVVTYYNKINSKSLHRGQKIKFPSIQLNGDIYRPKGSHPQLKPTQPPKKPTPTPTIIPKPTPTFAPPESTITPTPEPVSYFNQAIELFKKERYADAVAMLNNVPDSSAEKEDSLRLLSQCHFKLARIAMEKRGYSEARDTFDKVLEICQRLQGTDLPSECEQIEDLVRQCDSEIKIKAIEEHLVKGKQLLNANRIDPAIAEFEKVLALEPNHSDALEYLYLAHTRKASRLWDNKEYRKALEEFMTAWEYNQNCEECRISINKIKGVLYRKAKGLEDKLDKPDAPAIRIFQEQIEYYSIINQVDPDYEDVAILLEKARKRKSALERINPQKSE